MDKHFQKQTILGKTNGQTFQKKANAVLRNRASKTNGQTFQKKKANAVWRKTNGQTFPKMQFGEKKNGQTF
jgi:hypothetical protein